MSKLQSFQDNVIADTQNWLERAVIGLNLCPFAKAVHTKAQIHYAVSAANEQQQLLDELRHELSTLDGLSSAVRETTLVIVPGCLQSFLDFNEFLGLTNQILEDMGLVGSIQIASFHPNYQFAGTSPDDISNFTNRSPYPTLHLLREASVDRAVAAYPQAERIFEKNIQTLQDLGHAGWAALRVGPSFEVDPVHPHGKIKP